MNELRGSPFVQIEGVTQANVPSPLGSDRCDWYGSWRCSDNSSLSTTPHPPTPAPKEAAGTWRPLCNTHSKQASYAKNLQRTQKFQNGVASELSFLPLIIQQGLEGPEGKHKAPFQEGGPFSSWKPLLPILTHRGNLLLAASHCSSP